MLLSNKKLINVFYLFIVSRHSVEIIANTNNDQHSASEPFQASEIHNNLESQDGFHQLNFYDGEAVDHEKDHNDPPEGIY